jgi:hypothetical protein
MIIPRRDLLTGTALVLVGSASGCAKPPATAPAPPPASAAPAKQPLRTKFIADFTTQFIGDPTTMPAAGELSPWPAPNRVWPDPKTSLARDVVVSQFATFVNLLMTFGYVSGPPPAKPSDPLGASIWQFLVDQKWPGTPPPGYDNTIVPLEEIAVILDRLLQAMNSYQLAGPGSGGGPPGSWGPH